MKYKLKIFGALAQIRSLLLMCRMRASEDPEESGSENAALFDSAADVEGLRGAAIELHSLLHVAVEGPDQVLQLGWAANLSGF